MSLLTAAGMTEMMKGIERSIISVSENFLLWKQYLKLFFFSLSFISDKKKINDGIFTHEVS